MAKGRGNAGLRWFVSGEEAVIASLIKVDRQSNKTAKSLKRVGKASGNIAGRGFDVLSKTSGLLFRSLDRAWRIGNRVVGTVARIGRAALATAAKVAKLTAAIAAVGVGVGVGAGTVVFRATEKFKLAELSLTGIIGRKKAAEVAKISTEIAAREPAQFQDLLRLFTAISVTPGLRKEFERDDLEPFLQNLSNTIQAMLIVQPQQGITGAIIALQEAVSGNLRSLQRRFNVPLKTLKDITGFTTQEELGAHPLQVLQGVSKFFTGIVPPKLLLERAQTISVQFGNITEQLERFAAKVGETGPYAAFVTILADIAIALGEFRRSAKGAEVAEGLGGVLAGAVTRLKDIGDFVFEGFSFDTSVVDNAVELFSRVFTVIKQEGSDAFEVIKKQGRVFFQSNAPKWLKDTVAILPRIANEVRRIARIAKDAIPGVGISGKLEFLASQMFDFADGLTFAITKAIVLKNKLLEISKSPFIAGVKEAAGDLAKMARSLLGIKTGAGGILQSKGAGKASTFLLAALLGGGVAKQTGLVDFGKAVGRGGAAVASSGPVGIAATAGVGLTAAGIATMVVNRLRAQAAAVGPAEKAESARGMAVERVRRLRELSGINPSFTAVAEAINAGLDRVVPGRTEDLTRMMENARAALPGAEKRLAGLDEIAQGSRSPAAIVEQGALAFVAAMENLVDPDKKLSFGNVLTLAGELMNSTVNGIIESFAALKDAITGAVDAITTKVSDLLGLGEPAGDDIASRVFRRMDLSITDVALASRSHGRKRVPVEDLGGEDPFAPIEGPNPAKFFHRAANGEFTLKLDGGTSNAAFTGVGATENNEATN